MKILALGGSGGMGRFAVKSLLDFPIISKIIVADLNESSAKQFAANFNEKVEGVGLDVTDHKKLSEAMSAVQVVINTTGPFYKFAEPILRIAIENKCNYLDICDDWEPTEKMLSLNETAKKNGITAILGIGASPGITNVLGALAIRELDSTEKIYTGWDISSAKPAKESSQSGVNAAMLHGIEQMIGRIKIFRNYNYELIRPLSKINFMYPEIGSKSAYVFGHPEAITFPYHYPDLKESINLMHGATNFSIKLIKIIRAFVELNILTKNWAAKILESLETNPNKKIKLKSFSNLPGVYAYAEGIKNGKRCGVGVSLEGEDDLNNLSMGEATGFPLACGVKMLLNDEIKETGVFAPESQNINPELFFQYLEKEIGETARIKPIVSSENIF